MNKEQKPNRLDCWGNSDMAGQVAVIILCYNEGPGLRECLRRVFSQHTECAFNVLVIDSSSTDGTAKVAHEFPAVRWLQIELAQFNHGTTRNLGAASTTGEFIVFLNGHAWPADEHWLSALVAPLSDPRVAGVYSRQLPKPGCNPAMASEGYMPPIKQTKSFVGLSETDIARHLRELIFFTTVSCAIRRSVWEQISFLDDIPAAEDQDWAKRVLAAGYTLVYEPDSRVLHSHNYSPRQYYQRAYQLRRQMIQILGLRPSATRILAALPARIVRDVVKDATYMHGVGQLTIGALFNSLCLRTANSLAVMQADWEGQ